MRAAHGRARDFVGAVTHRDCGAGVGGDRPAVDHPGRAPFLKSPTTALPVARALGARVIRVFVQWSAIAPKPDAAAKPRFDAVGPGRLPGVWLGAVRHAGPDGARNRGSWSTSRSPAADRTGRRERTCRPSTAKTPTSAGGRTRAMYGQFVHAVTKRYDGRFTPSDSTGPLPAVRFWSFWNQPNFGQDLGPQAVDGSTKPIAPALYRSLLHAGYAALRRTQPGEHDTVLIGELAATGYALHAPGHPGKLPASPRRRERWRSCARCTASTTATSPCRGRPPSATDARRRRLKRGRSAPTTRRCSTRRDLPTIRIPHAERPTRTPPRSTATSPPSRCSAASPRRSTASPGRMALTNVFRSTRRIRLHYEPAQPAGLRYPTPHVLRPSEPGRVPELQEPSGRLLRRISAGRPEITALHPKPGFSSGLSSRRRPEGGLNAYRLPLWLPMQSVQGEYRDRLGWGPAGGVRRLRSGCRVAAVRCRSRRLRAAAGRRSGPSPFEDDRLFRHPHAAVGLRQPAAGLHLPGRRAVPAARGRRDDDLRPLRHGHRQRLTADPR